MVTNLLAGATLGCTATGAAANSGDTSPALNGTNSIGSDDIASLIKALDPAYRRSPRCGFAMNDDTASSLMALKDQHGGLVFPQERDDAGRWLLFDFPVFCTPSMDGIGSGKKCVVFADFSRMVRREVENSLRVVVLHEKYAEYGKVAYVGHLRSDSGLLTIASSPSPAVYLVGA